MIPAPEYIGVIAGTHVRLHNDLQLSPLCRALCERWSSTVPCSQRWFLYMPWQKNKNTFKFSTVESSLAHSRTLSYATHVSDGMFIELLKRLVYACIILLHIWFLCNSSCNSWKVSYLTETWATCCWIKYFMISKYVSLFSRSTFPPSWNASTYRVSIEIRI